MTYAELRTLFKGILNRTDCDDTLADQFIGMGLTRLERILRTPIQTQTFTTTTSVDTFPLLVPSDLLAVRSIRINNRTVRRESETMFETSEGTQGGYKFIFQNEYILVSPVPSEGSTVEFSYFREFTEQTSDADSPDFSSLLADVVTYAALVFAADWFVDIRKNEWLGTMLQLADEVQKFSDSNMLAGGAAIRNPYAGVA